MLMLAGDQHPSRVIALVRTLIRSAVEHILPLVSTANSIKTTPKVYKYIVKG